jgi:hypothetical protein
MELLSESSTGDSIPPLVNVSVCEKLEHPSSARTRAPSRGAPSVYTPSPAPLPPPPSVSVSVRKLTREQEANLVSRLYRRPRQEPLVVEEKRVFSGRSLMNPKSVQLTKGLEPIDVRAKKLIESKERRMDRLIAERDQEERRHTTGVPAISERSRQIAMRLTPERREAMVQHRRAILERERIERENEHCLFHPLINEKTPGRRERSFSSVTERLVRDADGRKIRQKQRERDSLLAETETIGIPQISPLAKSMFSANAPVHDRLYHHPPPVEPETRVVSFNDFYSSTAARKRLDLSTLFSAPSSHSRFN